MIIFVRALFTLSTFSLARASRTDRVNSPLMEQGGTDPASSPSLVSFLFERATTGAKHCAIDRFLVPEAQESSNRGTTWIRDSRARFDRPSRDEEAEEVVHRGWTGEKAIVCTAIARANGRTDGRKKAGASYNAREWDRMIERRSNNRTGVYINELPWERR